MGITQTFGAMVEMVVGLSLVPAVVIAQALANVTGAAALVVGLASLIFSVGVVYNGWQHMIGK